LEAYNFMHSEKDYCLYLERRMLANQVERVLEGLLQAICEEKEAAVERLEREKERMTLLIALAYEEAKWRLEQTCQDLILLLHRYRAEVENYTRTKEHCIASEISELREAAVGSVLAFSLQDVACEVVETVLASSNWHSELCLSSEPCPAVPCDLEERLEAMLLHGYGSKLGTEKIADLMQKAKDFECEKQWEIAGNLYRRAASLAELYSPCKAAELWVFLGKNSKKFRKSPSKDCFNRAFSLLEKLKIDYFSSFSILQSMGKLGIQIGEFEAAVFALEQAIVLPSLQPDQQLLGLLNLSSALAAAGQTGNSVARLEAALGSFPAPPDQARLLAHMGELLHKANKHDEADQAFSRVFKLSETYLSQHNIDLAKQILQSIINYTRATSPKSHFRLLESIGKLYRTLKEWDRAYETYVEWHKLTKFRSEQMAVLIGKICLKLQRRSDGIRILQRTIQELQVERKNPSPELKAMLQRLQANS
jgi:tetratricopeptide (TPR) repeat protein